MIQILVISFIVAIYNPKFSTEYKIVGDGHNYYDEDFEGEIVTEDHATANMLLEVWGVISWLRILVFIYMCMSLYKTYRVKLEKKILAVGNLQMIEEYFMMRYQYLVFIKNVKRWVRW